MTDHEGSLVEEQAERALLGCVFLDQTVIPEVEDYIRTEDFYGEAHRTIWEAMLSIHRDGADVDAPSLASELRRVVAFDRCGGAAYLDQLLDAAPVLAHPITYARAIAKAARRRRLRMLVDRVHKLMSEPTATEDQIEKSWAAVERELEHSTEELPSETAEELDAVEWPQKTNWLIHGWWFNEGCGLVTGDEKSAKSILTLTMAMSVASGEPWLRSWPIALQGPVVYVNEEDHRRTVQERIRKLKGPLAIGSLHNRLHICCQRRLEIVTVRGRGRLAALVRRVKPVLLVLDCWRRLAPRVDENESKVVSEILGWLRKLQIETGCAIVLVHHWRKMGQKGDEAHKAQRMRGSGDFSAWYDNQITVEHKKGSNVYTISGFHRSAGDSDEQNVHIVFDDPRNEVRIFIGQPPTKKGRQKEMEEAF